MRCFIFAFVFCFSVLAHNNYAANTDTYSKQYYNDHDAIYKIFPKTSSYSKKIVELSLEIKQDIEKKLGFRITNTNLTFYKIYSEDKLIGYSLVLDEKGKYKPITFMTGITPDLRVKDIVVMIYREKIGSEVRKSRFLRQFKNKTQSDSLVVDKNVMGISGATISTWSVVMGVRRALVIIGHLI